MDERTPLRETHDCGILLQHKVEALPSVERAFVHIDYQHRLVDDHDLTTPVTQKMHASIHRSSPLESASADSLAALLADSSHDSSSCSRATAV